MDQQKMELRKIRDFGEVLNDTFQFIKQEFKPLLLSFIVIAGIPILLSGIIGGLYQQDSMNGIIGILKGVQYRQRSFSEIFNGTYFLLIFLSVLSMVVMRLVLSVYVKLYDAKGRLSPTIEEVWKGTFRYLVPVFIYTIIIWLLIIVGMVCCIAPGIYFMVVFAPVSLVYVVEDLSFGEGFNRCFVLIKNNFWNSIGLYIVAYLIYSVSSGVVGVVTGALAGVVSYFSTKNISSTVGVVTGVLNIFQRIFYVVLFIPIALQYFNLVEQQDNEGLMRRLDSLGGNDSSNTQTEEQY
jgi:hypothetical protein